MKTRFLPGLLVALTMFVSCISELRDPELSKSEIVFTAMTEPQMDSRTSIEAGTQVYWEPEDKITVFSGSRSGRFISRLSVPVATASFYGSMEGWSSAAEVLALYPESEDAVCSGGLITTTLPSRQYARAGSFAQGTNLAVARSTSRTLQFYNVGGGVRFTLAEEGIKKVVFESLGDEWLAGKVRVGFEDGRPKVLEVTEGSRYVTLIPPDGETFETGKWYYIVAIPGALEKGYSLKFYKDEVYAQRVSEAAVTIKRSIYGSIENADAGLEYEPIPNLTEWMTDKTMRGVQYSENGGGEGGEGGEGETGEIVNMPPEALFVMDDLNDLLQSFDDQNWTITYNDGPALTEADIKVGDVLYSMPVGDIAPEGYILRVTGVRKEGERVVYDVEPAGLEDAFEHLSTDIPIDTKLLTANDITFYDILEQPDQSDWMSSFDANESTPFSIPTRSVFDSWSVDITKVTDTTKLKIKVDPDKTKVTYTLVDADNDYKTTYDQIRLIVTLEYEFGENCLHFDYDASKVFLSLDFAPTLGVSCGFEYGSKGEFDPSDIDDTSPVLWDAGTVRKMSTMQEKLLGKKVRILSYDLTNGILPKAIKAVVRPTIELYAYFNVSLEGNLQVSFGLEKTPWHLRAENIPYTTAPNLLRMIPTPEHITPYAKFSASIDFKGSTGLGVGVVARLPKVSEKISYKDPKTKQTDVPWMGFFFEWGLNAKAKVKSWVDIVSGKLHTDLSVDVYNELNGYLEAFAHLKTGWLFNPKVDLVKKRIPEESLLKYEYSWVREPRVPTPILISPSNREAVDGSSVSLQWKIPKPDPSLGSLEQFLGLQYCIYAGTNKDAVSSLNESCIIGLKSDPDDATRFDMKSMDFSVDNMKTYWWKVVYRNGKGETFESPLGSFDCGYDGRLVFDTDLSNWLSDHFEALGDVYIQEDGSILRTASNIKALAELKTLEIMDGGIHYDIKSIDELLRNLPSLETLDCRNNSITSLDLSHNPKLKSLVCNGNQISDLDLSNNKLLDNLSCKNNLLVDLVLSDFPLLENISCSENRELETLVFSACPKLTTVSCPNCKISKLDLSESYNLRDLYAAENHLDSLDISRCPNLIRLDIYAQYKERLKLRLTQAQYDGFALFKRHVNTDFEFVGTNGVEILLSDITNHSATVKVTMLDRGSFTGVGLFYSILEGNPSNYSNPDYVADMFAKNKLSETFTLDNLRSDTGYYVRGYAFDASEMRYYLGNTIHFVTLHRDPAPELSIIPENVHFGEVDPGRTVYKDLIFKNTGEMDLTYEIPDPNMDPFSIKPYGQTTLHPGDSVIHTVAFFPKSSKEYDAYFTVKSNDYRGDQYIYANGKGAGNYHPEGIPDVVDMGLSVHWASFNLGATQPEERGARFAWGETNTWKDHGDVVNPWAYYKWSDADDPDEYSGEITKYNSDDGKTVLDPEDDAAYEHLGGYWRMPTREEWLELLNRCDQEWSSNVVKLTSKVSGKSIYLPIKDYWTSSPSWGYSAYSVSIKDESIAANDHSDERYMGLYIRPVFFIPIESVSLNESQIEVNNFQSSVELKATVSPIDAMNKHFVWEADIPNIIGYLPEEGGDTRTVSFDGAVGSTTVTVYADDGKHEAKSASCRVVSKIYIEKAVIVTAPDDEIYPNYEYDNFTFHIIPGEKLTFNAMYLPENASEYTDTKQWVSDDPSIATVSDSGVVTGVKSGSTVIRVRYKSWNNTYQEDYNTIVVSDPGGSHEGFGGEYWD